MIEIIILVFNVSSRYRSLFRTETELRLTRVEESVFIIYKYVVFTKRCADRIERTCLYKFCRIL